MEMIRDLIPYDTPNYAQRLREMAIGCLRAENDPNLISLCEEHDRMLDCHCGKDCTVGTTMTIKDKIVPNFIN